ncbi:MAG TPA: hypothetical protein VK875_11470 [Euzebyales bacterium]|nr:hypothetical protein [Euzebyales bacterium]
MEGRCACILLPANGPSASRILLERQHLEVGDHVPDGAPETGCRFIVRRIAPGRLLVLHSDSHLFGSLAEREDVAMDWVLSTAAEI